ncbi:MAG: hypothetical protein JSS29_01530 [Proteobacteria bacterium]|nr:hypothetical protein [Pseudomonadota bacterium]
MTKGGYKETPEIAGLWKAYIDASAQVRAIEKEEGWNEKSAPRIVEYATKAEAAFADIKKLMGLT